ncbi:hypothetical protein TNCV_2303021 [Trichonephila clavipes]|nr:hypothetical protein TNCV_2303021 [Trichonephila clavipes]
MANSRMTFCKVCFQSMPPHIQTVLSASFWINWLSSLIRFLRLLVHIDYLCGQNCSSTIPVIFMQCSANHGLSRQADPRAVSTKLTRERNSSRHQRYSSDRRKSHSRSRNRGSGICYYHRRYKEQARKCVSPCAFVQKNKLCHSWNGRALETYQPVIFIRPQVWPEIPHRLWK